MENFDKRSARFAIQLIWLALLVGQFIFLIVVVFLHSQQNQPADPGLIQTLTLASFCALVAIPLGYFIRNQVYKRGWVEHAVAPASYVQGNLVLLACCEAVAFFSLIVTLLAGSFGWPTAPALLALTVHVLNFPTGRPLEPDVPEFAQSTPRSRDER